MTKKRDHDKRKTIICKRCNKDKLNFGLGMCSACLRHTKRETRPSFYLGTCYSEMSRRVKTFDPLRPKYFGKKKCTKEEFMNRFLNDKTFLKLYKGWQDSGFQRRFSPSIDRIDNNGDYLLDNLQFLVHTENTGKDSSNKKQIVRTKVIDSDGIIYNSIGECAKSNNTSRNSMTVYIVKNKEFNGKRFKKYEP